MEVWKQVTGYPNYHVSSNGIVKNVVTGNILTPTPTQKGGYLTVTIGGKRQKLNRVVAIEFIPNPLNLPQVHHKDKDVRNNAASNLEWITNKENNKTENKNKKRIRNKFTKEEVFAILTGKNVKPASDLAKEFDCGVDAISKVWRGVGANNKLWRDEYNNRQNI